MTKYQAYPEWGHMVKINLISMYCCIVLIVLLLLVMFVLKKKRKEKPIIFPLEIITYISFISTAVSKIIVELDIYKNVFLYYIIAMIIIAALIVIISNRLKKRHWIVLIMLLITSICIFTNQHTYPNNNASDVLGEDLLLNHSFNIDK